MWHFRGPTGPPFSPQGGKTDGRLFLGGRWHAMGPPALGLADCTQGLAVVETYLLSLSLPSVARTESWLFPASSPWDRSVSTRALGREDRAVARPSPAKSETFFFCLAGSTSRPTETAVRWDPLGVSGGPRPAA